MDNQHSNDDLAAAARAVIDNPARMNTETLRLANEREISPFNAEGRILTEVFRAVTDRIACVDLDRLIKLAEDAANRHVGFKISKRRPGALGSVLADLARHIRR